MQLVDDTDHSLIRHCLSVIQILALHGDHTVNVKHKQLTALTDPHKIVHSGKIRLCVHIIHFLHHIAFDLLTCHGMQLCHIARSEQIHISVLIISVRELLPRHIIGFGNIL